MAHRSFCLPKTGGGNTTTYFFSRSLCLHLVAHCPIYTFSPPEASLPVGCTTSKVAQPQLLPPAAPLPCLRAPGCLLRKKGESGLESQGSFIICMTVILGNFEFILVPVLRKGINYSPSPIKCVPGLLLCGRVSYKQSKSW